MATLRDSSLSENDRTGAYGIYWTGQTFTASGSYTISQVALTLCKAGDGGGTMTVSIRNTTNGLPTGADLCSGTYDANTLTSGEVYNWYTIDLGAGAALTSGTMYAICIRTGGNASNWIHVKDGTASSYAGGREINSEGGTTWGFNGATTDTVFKTYSNDSAISKVNSVLLLDISAINGTLKANILKISGVTK